MKSIYLIEIRRMRSVAGLTVLIFAGLAASLYAFTLMANGVIFYRFLGDIALQSIGIYIMISVGLMAPIICLTKLGGDMSSGVFSSYSSYPIKVRHILLGKWLAHYTYLVPCVLFPFLLLAPLIPYLTLLDIAYIIALLLMMLFITFVISIFAALFMDHRPLPEVLVVSYALLFSIFENMIPIPEPYIYALDPLRFLRALYSQSLSVEAVAYGVLSIPLYLAILYVSLHLFERKKWGEVDRL